MTDEEFRAEMRTRAIDMTNDFQALLKIDIQIMEATRDMVNIARDEVRNRPSRFFEGMGGSISGVSSGSDVTGSAGPAAVALGGFAMDLIKEEAGDIKEFVKDKVGKLLE
jgi:hypothetical protein